MAIPIPRRTDPHRPSLCDLPTEIRLEICTQILELSNIPRSYGYTGANSSYTFPVNAPSPTPRKHGMIIVCQKLGAEYRQAYYERTRFFLRIDRHNAFTGVPALGILHHQNQDPGRSSRQGEHQHAGDFPNFWSMSAGLLSNLRHCTLYVEIGDIASAPDSSHTVAHVVGSQTDIVEARRVRQKMKTFSSFSDLKARDAVFDATIAAAIRRLLEHMQQLRSVQLVWETAVPTRDRHATVNATNWMWASLGQPFVDDLKGRRHLRSLQVKVGDSEGDNVYQASRGEGGNWVGGLRNDARWLGMDGFT